jgi:uncharacterized RDD family membrane protein YckC
MRITHSDIDIFRRASPAKASKRFVSLFLDLVLAFFLTGGLFYGAYGLVKTLPDYQESASTVQTEIAYYNDLIETTHLVVFEDKADSTRYDSDVLSLKAAARQIVLTYDTLKASGTLGDFAEPTGAETEAEGEEASYVTDNVAYFYTQYVPLHNANDDLLDFGGLTPEAYYIKTLKAAFGDNASLFVYGGEAMPYLTLYAAEHVNAYLYGGGSDDVGKGFYEDFYYAYDALLSGGEDLVLNGASYHATHFEAYLSARDEQAALVADALIASIVLSYLLIVLLPQLLFRDGRTIGRLILGLGVIDKEKKEIRPWQIAVRSLLGVWGFWNLAFLLPVLPPFNFDYSCVFLDFLTIGSFGISLALADLVIALLALANGSFILLTHDRASAMDWLTRSVVVDKRHLDEPDVD